MRIKLDENVPVTAVRSFTDAGHDADTVADEDLSGTPDDDLLERCRLEGRLLVTFDVGFGDIRAHPPGSHAGVVLLRLSDQQPASVLGVLERLVASEALDDLAGSLVVVTEDRTRIRAR